MIITIDGKIATGKSTVAKKLAQEMGFIYFDTGAMYRALTYAILKNHINPDDPEQLQTFLDDFNFDIKIHRGEKRYYLGDEDITDNIRHPSVTDFVSKVSAIKAVREKLIILQRELAKGVNAVFEGRDMGTVVFPDAEAKIFLTGDSKIRARRRFEELKLRFPDEADTLSYEKTLESINKRDTYDSTREISPLIQAEDAHVLDTSELTIDEVVDQILEYIDSLPTATT